MNEIAPSLKVKYAWKDNFNQYRDCIYQGSKSNLYITAGEWRVKNCSCLACCFGVGEKFRIDSQEDYQNKPSINYSTGELNGSFCENTLAQNDFCYASSHILILILY